MKFKLILSFILLTYNAALSQAVDSFKLIKETAFNHKKVYFDMDEKIVGHHLDYSAEEMNNTIRLPGSSYSKIKLTHGRELKISTYQYTKLDQTNHRIYTYGYSFYDDHRKHVNLAIYNMMGQLLFFKAAIVAGDARNIKISKAGDFYITGTNQQHKQFIIKVNNHGVQQWKVALDQDHLKVTEVLLAPDEASILVLQSKAFVLGKKLKTNSNVSVINLKGEVINSYASKEDYKLVAFINQEKIILSDTKQYEIRRLNKFELLSRDLFETKISRMESILQDDAILALDHQSNIYLFKANDKFKAVKKIKLPLKSTTKFHLPIIKSSKDNTYTLFTRVSSILLE